MVKLKTKYKLIFAILFIFIQLLGIFAPLITVHNNKVYAVTNSEDLIKKRFRLAWFKACLNDWEGLTNLEVAGDNDALFDGKGRIGALEDSPIVGYINTADGVWDCDGPHGTQLAEDMGYKSFGEYKEVYYKKVEGLWEPQASNAFELIKNKVDTKLTEIDNELKKIYNDSDALYYLVFLGALNRCSDNTGPQKDGTDIVNPIEIVNFIDDNGKDVGTRYYEIGNLDDEAKIGIGVPGDGGGDGVIRCQTAIDEVKRLGNSWREYKATAEGEADESGSEETDDATEPNCEGSIFNVGWIICPIIDGAFAIMRVVEGAVVGQLKFDLDSIGGSSGTAADTTANIKKGHNSLLVTANILFAIGILWIVISQAITGGGGGGGFFGAYEAKKILPKLIAGIIVANFSWELVNLLLILTNALGDSIKSIMLIPFGDAAKLEFSFNNGSDFLLVGIGGIAAVGLAIFGFFAVSPILIMIIIAILSAIVFAILRKGMIIVLVTFAPVMLALSPFMPNLFKRYYKLLFNTIFFYVVVMVSVAACTIIGYITFQSAGGNDSSSTSIGQSLTKLLGIAFYFGWMVPVLAFAKNNFDVVGKAVGGLQGASNKLARQFGQKRLEGNSRKIKRDLLSNARKNEKQKLSYRSLVKSAQYHGRNPLKNAKRRYLEERQAQGSVLTKKGRALRDQTKASNRYQLSAQDEKLSIEAGQAALSAESVSSFDAGRAYTVKDKNGNVIGSSDGSGNITGHSLENKMELQRALASGHSVEFQDVTGGQHTLDGGDKDIRFASAMSLGSAGDVSQIREMLSARTASGEPDYDTRKLARIAISSNESAFISKAPDLTSKPNRVAFGGGLTYSDVSGWHGSTVEEAVRFQSQQHNFLSDRNTSAYNQAYDEAYRQHGNASAAAAAAQTAVNSIDPNAWGEAAAAQQQAQAALATAMDTMENDPRRSDTRNQDKIDRYNRALAALTAPPTPSDNRLKRNIVKIGQFKKFNIYEFIYINDSENTKYIGLMAQDLLKDKEYSKYVIKMDNGFYAIDYKSVGFEFKKSE